MFHYNPHDRIPLCNTFHDSTTPCHSQYINLNAPQNAKWAEITTNKETTFYLGSVVTYKMGRLNINARYLFRSLLSKCFNPLCAKGSNTCSNEDLPPIGGWVLASVNASRVLSRVILEDILDHAPHCSFAGELTKRGAKNLHKLAIDIVQAARLLKQGRSDSLTKLLNNLHLPYKDRNKLKKNITLIADSIAGDARYKQDKTVVDKAISDGRLSFLHWIHHDEEIGNMNNCGYVEGIFGTTSIYVF